MIINPDKKLKLDMWCDADWAGLYGYEDPDASACVSSMTGYIITLEVCPIGIVNFKGKLQLVLMVQSILNCQQQ